MKKKKDCIKHKLWGRLKAHAHNSYRIEPCREHSRFYYLSFWCVDHYCRFGELYNDLEKAKADLEYWRQYRFERLVDDALYERRKRITDKL